jgi:hypothetical protein
LVLAAIAGGAFLGSLTWFGRATAPLPAAQSASQPTASLPAVAPVQPTDTPFLVTTANVEQIRRNDTSDLSVFRLAENPRIAVLDFASLAEQGRMLDRIAALTEKSGLPRDRIVDPQELSRAIQSEGGSDPWFYYGHDYSAAELARFFAMAAHTQVALTPEEERLRRLADQLGLLEADSQGALISIPRVGADSNVTSSARDTILSHELSHGEYFSNPTYARYVRQFWTVALTEKEREAFRAYLERQGYDRSNPEIMENETQAYLLFTADPRFFTPSQVGMSAERRADLKSVFLRDMPQGWLRELLIRPP